MPVTIYEYDINGEVVEEHDENGNVLVEYTREPDGTLISEHRNGVDSFYHYDGAGNTLALTDINGDVTDTFAYNASGEVTARTGTTPTPYQYHGEQGYYLDSETGQFNVQRRIFSPEDSRWLSFDPALFLSSFATYRRRGTVPNGFANDPMKLIQSFLNGTNGYVYCNNNPIMLDDPTGLDCNAAPDDETKVKDCLDFYNKTARFDKIISQCFDLFNEYAKILQKDIRGGLEKCLDIKIDCGICSGEGQGAYYNPESHKITLCANRDEWHGGGNMGKARVWFCHELFHAIQHSHCEPKPDPFNCFFVLWHEMFAYYCTNACRNGRGCVTESLPSARSSGLCKKSSGPTQKEIDHAVAEFDKFIKAHPDYCAPYRKTF